VSAVEHHQGDPWKRHEDAHEGADMNKNLMYIIKEKSKGRIKNIEQIYFISH
jgi:hypothetical protein